MKLNSATNTITKFSDQEYIHGLKAANEIVTHSFFYYYCGYIINDIRLSLMKGRVEYNELVAELYLYLSADDWRKLDTFSSLNGCSLKTWISKLAWRFFMQAKNKLLNKSCSSLDDVNTTLESVDSGLDVEISIDVNMTLSHMENKRYVDVLTLMFIEGYDAEWVAGYLGTSVSNVYNIKHRAIVQFVETYSGRK